MLTGKHSTMSDKDQPQNVGTKKVEETEAEGAGASAEGGSQPEKFEGKSGFNMETMRDYLARYMGIKENPPSQLDGFTLKGIAKYMASEKCKNVITMAGAGISTSAGIPDFRSPGTGLYDNLASYDLPHPQAIFDIEFFRENPKPFFVLAKELYPGCFKPTVCHYFIKMLAEKGKLLRHYTQNIDTLERVAGLDCDKLIEAHGTFHTSHCLKCNKQYVQDWVKDQIFADKVPICEIEDCCGVVKPDIVFFGEALPKHFARAVQDDFRKCDLLIIMGTSLQVQPFASLTSRVPSETPRLYINLEKGDTGMNPIAVLMFGGGGFNFDGEDNYRDVFHGSTCDAGCQELANLLGWGEELEKMVKDSHAKIDEENKKSSKASAPAGPKASAGIKEKTTPVVSASSSPLKKSSTSNVASSNTEPQNVSKTTSTTSSSSTKKNK